MKVITNNSLQAFEIYLKTPKGDKPVWIRPKQSVVVPLGYVSDQIDTLINRRMLSVRNA
jgi:threonyl-tRNA synthetase